MVFECGVRVWCSSVVFECFNVQEYIQVCNLRVAVRVMLKDTNDMSDTIDILALVFEFYVIFECAFERCCSRDVLS